MPLTDIFSRWLLSNASFSVGDTSVLYRNGTGESGQMSNGGEQAATAPSRGGGGKLKADREKRSMGKEEKAELEAMRGDSFFFVVV